MVIVLGLLDLYTMCSVAPTVITPVALLTVNGEAMDHCSDVGGWIPWVRFPAETRD
jgi:hypothetical protein